MSLVSQVRTKVRNLVNKVRRPSAVTAAQHAHLKAHPECAACDAVAGGQAHHIKPFNRFPALAANPDNFITLCEAVGGNECHLHCGHGGNFKRFDPDVVEDARDLKAARTRGDRVAVDKLLADIVAKRQVDAPS